ncbi:LPP20 family lipoprotein [Thiomicrospira microaerophila]|uniref:LPP20 family lipoprotein n=1 Tax=Thiomicrospira microaerophila TaxID=406020 RepID=UPI0005C816AC|nr:LPP20 family lipoprotein [Thiomicrospira microaerophila]
MKKQIMVLSLASVITLAGCEQNPKMNEANSGYNQNGALMASKQETAGLNLSDKDIERLAAELIRQQRAADQAAKPDQRVVRQDVIRQEMMPARILVQEPAPQEKIKITGVGYGAENGFEGFTDGQRRLMAIRASKLDAYRSLAEQIYGIKIDSNTSVATLTAQSDSFRARVNAVVRGARIVSITPMADNNYETVLEVFVDRGFFEDVFVYSNNNQRRMILEPMETCTMGINCYDADSYR